jgi:hypothetical protein
VWLPSCPRAREQVHGWSAVKHTKPRAVGAAAIADLVSASHCELIGTSINAGAGVQCFQVNAQTTLEPPLVSVGHVMVITMTRMETC